MSDDVKRWTADLVASGNEYFHQLGSVEVVWAPDHDAAMLDLQIVIDGLTEQAAKNDAYYEFEKKRLGDLIAARDRRIEEFENVIAKLKEREEVFEEELAAIVKDRK